MPAASRPRLVVLFGGVSAERDVSCTSAASVLAAVDTERFDVVPIGIDGDGRWLLADDAKALLESGRAGEIGGSVPVVGTELEPLPAVAPAEPGQQVVVLPLIHGPLGEDGTVQGMLELAGVPYVGSGVLASAVCMDKVAAKAVAAAAGIPQAKHLASRDVHADAAFLDSVEAELGLPVFVKPANMGSSVGVHRAGTRADLEAAVADALRYDEWVVVEEAVAAREIELGVLGNAELRVSVPGEIVPNREFYDYEDKYSDGGARLDIPAVLPDEVVEAAQALALDAFRVLRCDGYARVDLFYEEGGRGLLLNEINTIPGFTPKSMFPMLWGATGVAYGELITEMVRLAVERHAHRAGFGRPQPRPHPPDDGRNVRGMTDERIAWGGVDHLALVCRDMARTVEFYESVLGMALVKTVELPQGMGQHFFFDCGGGDLLAFFWFADAPEPAPGISAPAGRPDVTELTSAIGSMNHVAFKVPVDRIEEYRDRLVAAGVECSETWNHDDSEWGLSPTVTDDVFVRSVYFQDPDGILLELAASTRAWRPSDVAHAPKTAADAQAAAAATADAQAVTGEADTVTV